MADTEPKIEMSIGENTILLQGSEDFISSELQTIFDNIDFEVVSSSTSPDSSGEESSDGTVEAGGEGTGDSESGTSESHSAISTIADRLSIDSSLISTHFYVEDENIHLHNPYDITHKYALIGYCMLKREITGEDVFEQSITKEKLIEQERVPINDWGGKFMYRLRENGVIKNDPSSNKQKNIPFKITPKAEGQFKEWLVSNEDA